jgi:glutamyl-tRNA synthetase
LLKIQRKKCLDSNNRDNPVIKNMELWDLMKSGQLTDSCLRIKIDMKHPTANCRDPIIFRYINNHHYKAENIKVFPTYDFACPIIDSLEGVTHAFRSVEYSDRNDQYNIILTALQLRKPRLFCYGKVKFEGVALSKRKIKALVENGQINGWDDPRLFTLRGLLNHGLCLDALNAFTATLGFSSKTPPAMTPDKLWTINRKAVDRIASRYFCIPYDNTMEMTVSNVDTHQREIPKYIKNKDLGTRMLTYSNEILVDKDNFGNGEEISLMFWSNAFVDDNALTLNLSGDFKSTEKKVLWVAKNEAIDVEIDSCSVSGPIKTGHYLGEAELLNLNKGDYVQFIKMNYYMCTNVDREHRIISFIELS